MNRSKITGIAAAVITHTLLLIILFGLGLPIPYPPPPEEGMLINFGSSVSGRGSEEPAYRAEPPPSLPSPASASAEQTLTQDYEEAPVINTKNKKERKRSPRRAPASARQPAPEQPRTLNQDALFKGTNAGQQARSQGEGVDGSPSHNMGLPTGSPSASAQGRGAGGSVNLQGRSLVGPLPAPAYDVQETGRVVVKIKVDRNGRVVEAVAQQAGSTLINHTLYAAAERAAAQAKFTPAADGAPPHQSGNIIYVFKMGEK